MSASLSFPPKFFSAISVCSVVKRSLLSAGPLALGVCLLLLSPVHRAAAPKPRTVVLLTVDGMRWDAPDRQKLPNFARLEKEGAKAQHLVPPFPSLTFVSHATLATGCYPDKHGIVANGFLDRATDRRFSSEAEASWLLVPPLWAWAVQQGRIAAVAEWPCSAGEWQGRRPHHYRPYGAPGGDEATVAWILQELRLPPGERPSLILAWTGGPDHEGHAEGPDSEKAHAATVKADRLLGKLLAFLKKEGEGVTLLVASDHGMAKVTRTLDLLPLIPKKGYFPYLAFSGPLCNIYCKTPAQQAEVEQALASAAPGVKLLQRGEMPEALRYGGLRTGDLLLLAPPGTTFAGFASKGKRVKEPLRGMHGYDPATCPDMNGLFYAWGEGVKPGRKLGAVRAVDVAPTVCALLGLPPLPHADGKALSLGGSR